MADKPEESRIDDVEGLKPIGDAGTVRLPVPSNDPNDPLNWPVSTKISVYLTVCFFTFIANVNGSNFTVAIVPLRKHFHIDATDATLLVGLNVLMFGVGNIVWVPLMRVLGKRPVYLMALTVLTMANIWSAFAQTWGSLLGGRMLSGVGAACADATVPSLVAEMFYFDQRGHCMMFFHVALASGLFLGPLINAYIVGAYGWRWSCGFIAIFSGVLLVCTFLLVRETQYTKPRIQHPEDEVPAKRSFIGWLSPTVGYNPHGHFLRTFWDILRMATYPPVCWAGILIGCFVGWTIVIQIATTQTFTKSPYNWTTGTIGLFSLSAFIGALLSFYFGGRLIDLIATRARQRASHPRPEIRLVALIIPAIIGPLGVITYGQCVAHKTTWVGPAFGFGMHAFALTALSNVVVTYVVDCYQAFAGEALVIVFVIRNVIACVLSMYSSDWIAEQGASIVFGEMAAIQYFLLLFAVPLYFCGPALLKFTSGYGPMRRIG
ncbi:putative polyamine transporter [Aureobasidium pullulans]|nr:putative polyamine transporter [Aureobasidium pullulans]THX83553.1 putative polyamine transporter [Aureobasidium pullulans]THY92229.1 putative polyamine transporter [Aureobasidium pullulans]